MINSVKKQKQQVRQCDIVRQVMHESGGFATLSDLYQTVVCAPGWYSKSKTPFASIRRIVQDTRFFFKFVPDYGA